MDKNVLSINIMSILYHTLSHKVFCLEENMCQ